MTSDVVPFDDRRALGPVTTQQTYADAAVARLAEWAHSAAAAHEVAQHLVQTSFVPVAYRAKPHEATAAILAGAEIGLSPMAALRAFDIIQGQAAPRALTLRAIVQSQGHQIELVESTSTRCKMRGRRRGSSDWQTVTWTIDRARELGLMGKDPWRKQPTAMLLARATSELARLIAADAILGVAYSAEEYADSDAPEAVTDGPPAEQPTAGTRRLSRPRKPLPPPVEEPADEPPVEDEPAPVEEPLFPDQPEHITDQQLKKLHVVLKKAGLTDREAGLKVISDIVCRVVDSTKALSKDEASQVIDHLEDVDDGWGEGVTRPDGGER